MCKLSKDSVGLCGGTRLNAWSVCRLTCFYDEVMRYIRDEDYANR